MVRSSKKHFIQIVESKETTHDQLKQARKQKFENRIDESIGLRKVLEMICREKSVLVGHNLFQDLLFIWSQFFAKLPSTLHEFCDVVAETFPTSYPPLVPPNTAETEWLGCMIQNIFLLCIRCVGK